MKKIISLVGILLILSVTSLFASTYAANYTGDWKSGEQEDFDNRVNVGTTNVSGSTDTFDFYIDDTTGSGSTIIYGKENESLITGEEFASGYQDANMFGTHVGRINVDDNATIHQPWFNG